MSILRMVARLLALLWIDKRTSEACYEWIFMGDEVVYKNGVRVTVELMEEPEVWLVTRGNVTLSKPT